MNFQTNLQGLELNLFLRPEAKIKYRELSRVGTFYEAKLNLVKFRICRNKKLPNLEFQPTDDIELTQANNSIFLILTIIIIIIILKKTCRFCRLGKFTTKATLTSLQVPKQLSQKPSQQQQTFLRNPRCTDCHLLQLSVDQK